MVGGVLTVRVTTARTVAFMAAHEEIAERVSEWVDMMVDSMDKCMERCKTAGEEAQRTSALLEYMRGMERSFCVQLGELRAEQRVEVREMRDSMGVQMKDGMTGIGRSVEAIGGQVQQQVLALMGTVEGAVRGSLERMDAEAFGRAASERIQGWMTERLQEISRGQQVTGETLSSLTQRLVEELRRAQEPTSARHEHVMSVLSALPTAVSTAVSASTSAGAQQEGEARAAVVARLGELRVQLEGHARSQDATREEVVAVVGVMERLKGDVERLWDGTTTLVRGQQTTTEALSALSQRLGEELRHAQEPTSARHEHLLNVLSVLPTQVSAAMTTLSALSAETSHASDVEARAATSGKLDELRVQLEGYAKGHNATAESVAAVSCVLEKLREEQERMWVDMRDRGTDQKATSLAQMTQVPMMVKGVLSDMMKDVEAQWTQARATSKATQHQVTKVEGEVAGVTLSLAVQRKMTEDVACKLDAVSQQMTRLLCPTSQRVKGHQGENGLYELLCDRLTSRDDYEVEMVRGQAHGCDINIRRLGHADVRLESKAHGEGTGEKVRAKEVTRFQSDLLGLNAHGVFVSLHGGIVGKGELEIEQLANGKFAVYLSNNKYDVGIIHDMLMLLYRLDKITKSVVGEGGGEGDAVACIKVPQDTMRRVQLYMKDFASKVSVTKTHLKDSLSLLSELTFDLLERMLLGQVAAPVEETVPQRPTVDGAVDERVARFACAHCTKMCKTRGALTMHEKTHAHFKKVGSNPLAPLALAGPPPSPPTETWCPPSLFGIATFPPKCVNSVGPCCPPKNPPVTSLDS